MKVPNGGSSTAERPVSLSRLQNEGSQLQGDGGDNERKSIKATE